jgi:hypothetical protein
MAVELAKVSLWLITLMKGRPFGFLDHALKCGDALLGVTSLRQVVNFSLREGDRQATFGTADLPKLVEEAANKRRQLEQMPSNDFSQIEQKNRLHQHAAEATVKVKALADCLIAFELRGVNDRQYEEQLTEEASKASKAMKEGTNQLRTYARERLEGRRPFHWAVEFPEVFERGGFDAFVGNPPFRSGKRFSGDLGQDYRDFLVRYLAGGTRGHADLCTYFILKTLNITLSNSGVGMIATNTLPQGDTREVGLDRILKQDVKIIRALTNVPWPGEAAITVCCIWLRKGFFGANAILDGEKANHINSYLKADSQKKSPPNRLASNHFSYIGSQLTGEGFMLTPEEAQRLINFNSKNKDVLFPILRGEDHTNDPQQKPSKWVINFFDWPFDRKNLNSQYTGKVASDFPDVLRIIEEKVKSERLSKPKPVCDYPWWHFWCLRPQLYKEISKLERVIFHPFTSKYTCFGFSKTDVVFCAPHVVIADQRSSTIGLLQSSFHDAWVWENCSTHESRIRYAPTDCFETFPFPRFIEGIEAVAERYLLHRQNVMLDKKQGLTKTYNRFHDTSEHSDDIVQLRTLHVEMDQAVAAAYGWNDLDLGHCFHETKQGIRFTISESARREVLDRLLALNHQRYAEEVAAGAHGKKGSKTSRVKKARHDNTSDSALELKFD